MTRRCSHCANDGHNSRTCPSRGGGSGSVTLFGFRLTDGKKSANMGNLSAHDHSSSSAAAASPNPSSPSLDPIHDPLYLPDGYLSDDPPHAPSSSNGRAQRKNEKSQPSGVVSVQPLQVALPSIDTTERMTRSRLKAIQEAKASVAEARASPTKKRLREGLLVSRRGIGLSSDSDDDNDNDNLPIASRVTRLRTCRLVLPNAKEKPSAEAEPVAEAELVIETETMAEAEPIAEAEDVEEGHDIPPTESGQVPHAAEVIEVGMITEGVAAPNPIDPIYSDHSSVGGEGFVLETPREKSGARKPLEVEPLPIEAGSWNFSQSTKPSLVQQTIISSIPVAEGGEDVAATFDVGPPNLVQLAEVTANLATPGATATADTSDPVASATSEQLADLYPTHFPEVPSNLGLSLDFYTGMDTTILPDLNVEGLHIDDYFLERQGDVGSFGLSLEISSPGHLPPSTHSNVAGHSSSGEVHHPQTFGCSTSLPPITQASGDMRESTQPSAKVSFLSYWVSAEVTPILVRIQALHPRTFTAFNVPGPIVQTALLESFANFISDLTTKKVLTTSSKFVESVEANLDGFEKNGLDLSWMRARLQTVDGFFEHENNVAIITSLEEFIIDCEGALEQYRQNRDLFKEKDSALVAQLPQDVTLMDSLMKGLI
ncbi:hypothetical protein CsSME_00007632 [Camellia sinensis var. sinensis]